MSTESLSAKLMESAWDIFNNSHMEKDGDFTVINKESNETLTIQPSEEFDNHIEVLRNDEVVESLSVPSPANKEASEEFNKSIIRHAVAVFNV